MRLPTETARGYARGHDHAAFTATVHAVRPPRHDVTDPADVVGLIVAGGLARRLGGGVKGLRSVGGRPVLAHIVERLTPQCDGIVLSINAGGEAVSALGLPTIADHPEDRGRGPLAGILAGLDGIAALRPGMALVLTVPGDTPFLPADLLRRLDAARPDGAVVAARSQGRDHPLVALWPVALRHVLRRLLREEGVRGVGEALRHLPLAWADWDDGDDPFHNINTPDDLAIAEARAAGPPR